MRKVKCNPPNHACGGRCVPQGHKCAGDKGETRYQDTLETQGKKASGIGRQFIQRTGEKYVTEASAKKVQEMRRQEAIRLAGGEKELKREVDKIVADSGGGIPAVLLRNAARMLTPGLVGPDDIDLYLTTKKRGKYEQQVYRKDRKKFRHSDIIRKGDKIKKGDIIRVRLKAFPVPGYVGYHYGVYLGNGKIAQYGEARRGILKNNKLGKREYTKGRIRMGVTTLRDENGFGKFKWEKVEGARSKYSVEELWRRIKKVDGHTARYSLLTNNCEHFAYLLAHDKGYSQSTDMARKGLISGIIDSISLFAARGTRKKYGLKKSEMKHLTDIKFSEQHVDAGYEAEAPVGFKYPRSDEDIEAALMQAMKFAKAQSMGDKKSEIGLLGAWLKEYIENINVGYNDK